MAFATVFRRYELKYMITKKQKDIILGAMADHTMPDKYGIQQCETYILTPIPIG